MAAQNDTADENGSIEALIDELNSDDLELGETSRTIISTLIDEVSGLRDELTTAHRRNSELEETVDELTDELEAKDERIMQLEVTVDQQADRIEALEATDQTVATDGGTDTIDDERIERIEGEIETQSSNINGAFTKLRNIDDRLEDVETTLEGDDDDATPGGSITEDPFNTPLERAVNWSEDVAEAELTVNEQRARFIAKDVLDYTEKVGNGRKIDTSTVRRVLNAAEERTIHRTTVKRVMEFLDDLGGEGTTFRKQRDGQNMVHFTDELIENLIRADQMERNVVCYGGEGGSPLRAT